MKTILIILTFLTFELTACSCRGIEDYYSFFKNNSTSFVGKMVGYSGDNELIFEVIDKLRTQFTGKIKIYNNRRGAAGCSASFDPDKTYLIDVTKLKSGLEVSACSFIVPTTSELFSEDTMLINMFSKKDILVDCRYFKGEIKNGERTGVWEFYSGDKKISSKGSFVHDKKDGEWSRNSITTYYDKGKFLKMIELMGDNSNMQVVSTPGEKTLFYPDGKVFKKWFQNRYEVYSKNGKLIESVKVKKNGYLTGDWIIYNEDGTVKEKKEIDKDNNDYSAFDQVYDVQENHTFSK